MANEESSPVGLHWTSHPLIDHGIAALVAFRRRSDPASITLGDLDAFVDFAEHNYLSSDLSKTLGILFTINGFLNPSIKDDERKRERIREAVGAYRREGNPELPLCTFCGRPSLRVLHRDDVPMLLGRSIVNFYAGGRPGLAICGLCQTSLHGLVIGAPRCSGKALVVSADDPQLLLRLVAKWVGDCMRYATLAGDSQEAPKISRPRTRLVEALLAAQHQLDEDRAFEDVSSGLAAYSLSNSGQGPGIEIHALPSNVVGFLQKARSQRTANAWREIERRAWERVGRGGSAADVSDDDRQQYQNFLYEDLFRLPEGAPRFVRVYFLRSAAGLVRAGDPRADYRSVDDANLLNWDLTKLFLEEVLSMEQNRIDGIRSLGDRLAEEITEDNQRRLFQRAYRVGRPAEVRRLLITADLDRVRREASPMLTLSDFLSIFEEGEETARADWRLAWDLVLIRLIERLYAQGWFERHKDETQDLTPGADNLNPDADPAGNDQGAVS